MNSETTQQPLAGDSATGDDHQQEQNVQDSAPKKVQDSPPPSPPSSEEEPDAKITKHEIRIPSDKVDLVFSNYGRVLSIPKCPARIQMGGRGVDEHGSETTTLELVGNLKRIHSGEKIINDIIELDVIFGEDPILRHYSDDKLQLIIQKHREKIKNLKNRFPISKEFYQPRDSSPTRSSRLWSLSLYPDADPYHSPKHNGNDPKDLAPAPTSTSGLSEASLPFQPQGSVSYRPQEGLPQQFPYGRGRGRGWGRGREVNSQRGTGYFQPGVQANYTPIQQYGISPLLSEMPYQGSNPSKYYGTNIGQPSYGQQGAQTPDDYAQIGPTGYGSNPYSQQNYLQQPGINDAENVHPHYVQPGPTEPVHPHYGQYEPTQIVHPHYVQPGPTETVHPHYVQPGPTQNVHQHYVQPGLTQTVHQHYVQPGPTQFGYDQFDTQPAGYMDVPEGYGPVPQVFPAVPAAEACPPTAYGMAASPRPAYPRYGSPKYYGGPR